MNTANYYEVKVMKLRQIQTGIVLIGKLKFSELSVIHRLTERKESLIDPFSENSIKINHEDEEFQRRLRPNKLNKIAIYLEEQFLLYKKHKSLGLFPTSIIVAIDHDPYYHANELNEKFLNEKYFKGLSTTFINEDQTKLYIPKSHRIALIVDGQHRFYGLKRFYNSLKTSEDKQIIEDFEFPITFLIGFDIYQVGKVFATVNFTQKPVNRSLYYDIFGSVPDIERNDIKLAHDLALHLNNNDESPIQGMIKMLGTGYGLFSQSFFVEKMLMHFKEGGAWEGIYADYLDRGEQYKKLPEFMKEYLKAVEQAYNTPWPRKFEKEGELVYSPFRYDYILCKTTGLGAIFRLVKEIYPLVEDVAIDEMKDKIVSILSKISDKESANLFSKNGPYGEGGGEGLQYKLYRYLKNKLNLG